MIDYGNILTIYYLNNRWRIENSFDYNTLNWYDENKPTKEELDNQWEEVQSIIAKNNCKSKAKQLISNTDWSVLPDVNITNKSEFESYRNIIRNYIINPIENPQFPIEPQPVWSIE
jgi:hypothetical protein